MANRTRARMAELSQQVEALFHEICAAQTVSITLRKAIEAELDAMDGPLIGRRFPAGQKTPDPSPPATDGSRAIPYDELYHFLSALSDLEEENGFISELEYALQREELERLKSWVVDKKTWRPPDSN